MTLGPFTQQDQAYAACRVDADGTSNGTTDTNSYREGRFTSTTLASTGVFTLTMDPGLDAAEAAIRHRPVAGAANANLQSNQTSDTSITLSAYVGTVLTSMGFELDVRKMRSAT